MPKIHDREDAIALIQVVKDLYAESGIDVSDRLESWLSKAGVESLYDLPFDRVARLARTMFATYEAERLEFPILSQSAKQALAGMTPLEWMALAQEISPEEQDLFLDSLEVSIVVKQELLGWVWRDEKTAA